MGTIFLTILPGACAIVLIALLVIKEIIRAYQGPRTEEWMRKFNYAITPLLALFGILVLLRFLQML